MIRTDTGDGLAAGLAAYLIWGFMPVYFVIVSAVAPLEVLSHRIMWAVPFGALILTFRSQWPEVRQALSSSRLLGWMTLTAIFIAINWLVYIWAIQQERILETSLGYYINPLINVLAGVVILGERLRRLQLAAVLLATLGVAVLTVSGGGVPWVALVLAFSFAGYGVVRKRTEIGAMPGLFVETLLLLPFAIGWFAWIATQGVAMFGSGNDNLTFWLLMAGPVTAIPLLLFAIAARRLRLTTLGFLQFLAPTLQFGTGIYYGETLSLPHLICFACIWTAVAVFSYDAVRAGRSRSRTNQEEGSS